MIPIAQVPEGKTELTPEIKFGKTPEGKAFRFVHKEAYDEIDGTYETITAYLDTKDIVAKDAFIEEYVTDITDADGPQSRDEHLRSAEGVRRFPGLSRPQRPEPLGCNPGGVQRRREVLRRLVDRFVGELERAPMVAERLLGADELKTLHRIVRVHVLRLHEPARLVGADGQDARGAARRSARAPPKDRAVAEARVADVVDRARGRREHEGAPQRHAPVVHAARRPVIGGLADGR